MIGNAAATRVPGRTAVAGFALALVLQSLAPPGYMAGSIEDGWPVVLCPEGLPAGFLGHSHHHHEHDHGQGAKDARPDVGLDGHCPLGGMLDASAVLTAAGPQQTVAGAADNDAPAYEPPALPRLNTPRVSRAPPIPV